MIPIRTLLAIVFLVVALYFYIRREDPIRAIFWLVWGWLAGTLIGLVAVY